MPKATNISANEAAEIKYLPNNTVLISINREYDSLFPLQIDRNSSKVLTLQFSDITAPAAELNPINGDQVYKILDFINIHQGKDFIVHCAQGISRSSAICLYLHIVHGYELKKNFWHVSRPNPYVIGKLMIERYRK